MKNYYLVGGAVRDALMLKAPKDMDYVVIGASEQDMLNDGFTRVGESFPVFLHPETKEEYALARKERKIDGQDFHTAFEFETAGVTLEEDLLRRDLTINAIAIPSSAYTITTQNNKHFGDNFVDYLKTICIDPYNGKKDLEDKILRHVSPAFAEDPLRVLRVAKFAARFPDFTIAPETIELMKVLVQTDGFKNLSAERVYKEMIAALHYDKPSVFFNVLKEVGGLTHFFPELEKLVDVPQRADYHPEGDCYVHTMLVLDAAAGVVAKHKDTVYSMEIRFAALVHDLGKGITPVEKLPAHPGHEEFGIPLVEQFCDRLRVPNDLREAAIIVARNHLRVHRIEEAKASSIIRMFHEMGAFKKPYLVEILARACEADDMGKNRTEVKQGKILEEYFAHVKSISIKNIDVYNLKGEAIGNEIRATRVRKLKAYLSQKAKNDSGTEETL